MSFQNLLEGDCGGQNPLVKLGSHFTQDQAYRQERVHPLSPDFTQADLLVHEFLEDNLSQNVQTFRMDELFREMRDIESNSTRSAINQAPNVAQLAASYKDNFGKGDERSSIWAQQFLGEGKQEALGPFPDASASLPAFEHSITMPRLDPAEVTNGEKLKPVQANMNDLGEAWGLDFEKMKTFDESQFGLGKDWVENFLKNGESEMGQGEEAAAAASAADEKEDKGSSKFIKFMKSGKSEEDEMKKSEDWSEEYLKKELDEAQLNTIWGESSEGAAVATTDDGDYSNQFWRKLQKEWEKMSKTDGDLLSWEKEYSEFVDPFKEYKFDSENPMKELESPFEEGLRKLEENDLPSAVLCFEAAAQADPENPLAWQYLGTTQAENEQDPYAIAALKKCISLQGDNLVALMSLAISYTNENYQNQACQMLKQWLQNNPKYSESVKPDSEHYYNITSLLSSNIHNEVRDLFIEAANRFPTGEIDVDVQCGLGVLFNLSSEIDKAVDCFKAALQARPKDFRMWNRLGATLANGHRSEEAVDAYYNALHLSPGFIRARYNLGITCVNLGANREAAEHLLTALNQQASGRSSRGEVGAMSESIWSTLRLVVNLLGKPELLAAVEARDLPTLSKEFNIK